MSESEPWLGPDFHALMDAEQQQSFVTTEEFLAEPDDPAPSYLGDGVIPKGGLVVVAGESAIGKTTHNLNCAIHLSQGEGFHGLVVPEKLRVLFLECESNRTQFRSRLRTLCSALGMTSEVLFMPPRTAAPRINELGRLVEEAAAHVIFLDTIGYFTDAEENSATEWKQKVAKPLREISRSFDWQPAFVAVTHFGKPADNRAGAHRTRGSSAIIADSDTGITLENRDGYLLQTFEKIRNGPPLAKRVLELDPQTGVVSWSDVNAQTLAEPRMATVQAIVLRRSDQIPTGELVDAVCKETKLKKRAAELLIERTLLNGLIEKPRRGFYAAPGRLL